MHVKDKRPVNLDLLTLKFPVVAIVSGFHRLSGIVLFLLLPFMMYWLGLSLKNEAAFTEIQQLSTHIGYKAIFWVLSSALIYHVLAGIRHLIMDMGYGEGLKAGRCSAWMVIVISTILIILSGIWLW